MKNVTDLHIDIQLSYFRDIFIPVNKVCTLVFFLLLYEMLPTVYFNYEILSMLS